LETLFRGGEIKGTFFEDHFLRRCLRLFSFVDSKGTSCTIHGGTIRITEFRFPDDRIIRIEVYRNITGEDGA
jgi:hypothetical protein